MALKQRYKLYEAEDTATQPWRWFASVQGAQMWVEQRIRRKWWRSVSDIRHVILEYPHPGKMSETTKEGNVLRLQMIPDGLNSYSLIHEMAHGLVWIYGNDSEKDHGRRFAGALIECYRHLFAAEIANDLIREFDARGVKWDPWP